MSWSPCGAEECENRALEDHEFCDAHLTIKLLEAKLSTVMKAMREAESLLEAELDKTPYTGGPEKVIRACNILGIARRALSVQVGSSK